jgi:hypothetical protein
MLLYIELENGKPKNHPALESNLYDAFGKIPENWVLFTRIAPPVINVYEVYEGASYELVNGVYTDVHHVRPMTYDEINTEKSACIAAWNNRYPSWVFDEALCLFEPPVSYPQDDKRYYWDELTINWVEVTHEQNT